MRNDGAQRLTAHKSKVHTTDYFVWTLHLTPQSLQKKKDKKYSALEYKWAFGEYPCLFTQTSPEFQCSQSVTPILVLREKATNIHVVNVPQDLAAQYSMAVNAHITNLFLPSFQLNQLQWVENIKWNLHPNLIVAIFIEQMNSFFLIRIPLRLAMFTRSNAHFLSK